MNRKQFILLVIVGLLVGGAGYYLSQKDSSSWKSGGGAMGQKVVSDFPVNDVARVTIKNDKAELSLVKTNEVWTVGERSFYPANFGDIKEFLSKVWELKAVQSEEIGETQLSRLELVEPGKGAGSGTMVEFRNKEGKMLRSLILGKKHMKKGGAASPFGGGGGDEGWPDGRWVKVLGEAKSKDASLVTESFSQIEPKPEQWLNKDFFKVEKLKSIAVTHLDATNSWSLSRAAESSEMILAEAKDGEKLDSSKVYSHANAFSSASFNDVLMSDAMPEVTGLDKATTVKIETFEQFSYTIKVGKGSGEDAFHLAFTVGGNFPKEREPGKDEKKEDVEKLEKEFKEKFEKNQEKLAKEKELEKWIFLVSKWTVEPVQKVRKDLMAEKKDEAKEGAKDATKAAGNDDEKLPEPKLNLNN